MHTYRMFDPEDFGYYGSPAEDESFVLMEALDDDGIPMGIGILTYISCEDYELPPMIDKQNTVVIEIEDTDAEPIIPLLRIEEDSTITLANDGDELVLNEVQNDMLARPRCIYTNAGKMEVEQNDGGTILLTKDLTMDGLPPVKLDPKKAINAIKEKAPALLEHTHQWFGNRPPLYPHAKYFEDRDKMVVFIAKSQIPMIDDRVLEGRIPYYYDYRLAEKWDNSNIYGICIVDDTKEHFSMNLVAPSRMPEIKKTMKEMAEITR